MATRLTLMPHLLIIFFVAISITSHSQVLDSTPATVPNYNYHLGWIWPQNDSFQVQGFTAIGDRKFISASYDGIIFCTNDKSEVLWTFIGDYKTAEAPIVGDGVIYIPTRGSKVSGDKNAIIAIDTLGHFVWKYEFEEDFMYDPMISPDGSIYIETSEPMLNDKIIRVLPNGEGYCLQAIQDSLKNRSYGTLRVLGFDSMANVVSYEPWKHVVRILDTEGGLLKTCRVEVWPNVESNRSNIIDMLLLTIGDTLTLALDSNGTPLWARKGKNYIDGEISSLINSKENIELIVGTKKGKIYIINSSDGSIVNSIELGERFGSIDEMEWIQNELLIQSNSNNQLLILDRNGVVKWKTNLYYAEEPHIQCITGMCDIYIYQDGKILKYTTDTSQNAILPEPAPLPTSKEEAENEITQFMLADIIREIALLSEFKLEELEPQFQYMLKQVPPAPDLIIFAPVNKADGNGLGDISWKANIKTWLCKDGVAELQEKPDKAEISYRKKYISKDGGFMPWTYGIYKFGILSFNSNFAEAEVVLDYYCGRLCGHGSLLKLKRSPSGKWWIAQFTESWIS